MNEKFIPTNKLEEALAACNNGAMALPDFMKIFLASELILPSANEQQADGAISPLFFNKDGQQMLSVFTTLQLLKKYEKNIKHYIFLDAKAVLLQLPQNIGLVINPGYSVGFDISPDGIKSILKDFVR